MMPHFVHGITETVVDLVMDVEIIALDIKAVVAVVILLLQAWRPSAHV